MTGHHDGDVHAGQVLGGRYRLVSRRAERDDIAWWEGLDETLSRAVTLYIMPPNHPRADELLGVARKAGRVTDPRFLRVLDVLAFGPSEPVSMIVCEEIPGVSLQALLKHGPLAGFDAAWVIGEVASALAPLHEMGLSHGELSPVTVMLTTSGAVRIKGFMLFAALAGHLTGDADTRERADVAAIGNLFYACLTGAWPGERNFGLPSARRDGGSLVPPAQARPGVSTLLDAICTQIIKPRPGAAPLRTAAAISIALRKVLGTADARTDLALRVSDAMKPRVEAEEDEDITARRLGGSGASESKVPKPPPPNDGVTPVSARVRSVVRGVVRWVIDHWWVVAAAVVLIVVIALVAQSCSVPEGPGSTTVSPTVTQKALVIKAVAELDAEADGGDGKDNPELVPLATDGKDDTCWKSELYSLTYIPTRKPGIGLVLAFEEVTAVSKVTVTLGVAPAGVSIMVPVDSGVDSPPLASVGDWTSVHSLTVTKTPQTVTLPEGTKTRYLLLYFNKLPPVPDRDDRAQAVVCEVTATA